MRSMLLAALAVIAVTASAQSPSTPVRRLNPPSLATPTTYAQVVEVAGAARTIYVSGQIAFDRDGRLVGAGDMGAQAAQVFRNLEAALAAAGATFDDVVKITVYTTDMSQAAAIRAVRAQHFRGPLPASTFVQVVRLARPELMLEVEVVAAVGAGPGVPPAR